MGSEEYEHIKFDFLGYSFQPRGRTGGESSFLVSCRRSAEGGRPSLPQFLSEDQYRPHLVIGDPGQREAKMAGGNWLPEEYIGVAFHEGPTTPEAAKELSVVLTLMYFPHPMYGKLNAGTTFTVREGSNVVGYGTVRRWLD